MKISATAWICANTIHYDYKYSALYRCITYMEDSIMERHLALQATSSTSTSERDRVTSLFVSCTLLPLCTTSLSLFHSLCLSLSLRFRWYVFILLSSCDLRWKNSLAYATPPCYSILPCYIEFPVLSCCFSSWHNPKYFWQLIDTCDVASQFFTSEL